MTMCFFKKRKAEQEAELIKQTAAKKESELVKQETELVKQETEVTAEVLKPVELPLEDEKSKD